MLGETESLNGSTTKEPEKAKAAVGLVPHSEDDVVGASVPKLWEGMGSADVSYSARETFDTQATVVAQPHSDANTVRYSVDSNKRSGSLKSCAFGWRRL
jgi:hypothetical protein